MSSSSTGTEKWYDSEGLSVNEWARMTMPEDFDLATKRPGKPITNPDGPIGSLCKDDPSGLAIRRIAVELKRQVINREIVLCNLDTDPTKPPAPVLQDRLDRVVENIEFGFEDKRQTGLPPPKRHPIFDTWVTDDEKEWLKRWIFLDLRIYPILEDTRPLQPRKRHHLKVLVAEVVNDTPVARSLIDKPIEHGDLQAALKILMADPRLADANEKSVERTYRMIRTGK